MKRLAKVAIVAALAIQGGTALAAEVDRSLASDPAAAMGALGKMGLPDMPKELALELRGENIWRFFKLFRAGVYGYSKSGWELGRMQSINNGWGDPGSWPGFRCAVFGC